MLYLGRLAENRGGHRFCNSCPTRGTGVRLRLHAPLPLLWLLEGELVKASAQKTFPDRTKRRFLNEQKKAIRG